MTEVWEPYKPPINPIRGWRVGPTIAKADIANATSEMLDSGLTVDQDNTDANLGIAVSVWLDPELIQNDYVLDYSESVLPATAASAIPDSVLTNNQSITDITLGTASSAMLTPTMSIVYGPTITSMTWDSGNYDTWIQVYGTNFVPGSTTVTIGGYPVGLNEDSVTSTYLSFDVHITGLSNGVAYDVTLTTPAGSYTITDGFTYWSITEVTVTSTQSATDYPEGCQGMWIDYMLGAGGPGGVAEYGTGADKRGGAGGSGGGRIGQVFIPRADLGDQFSVTVPGATSVGSNGANTVFTNTGGAHGNWSIQANGGLKGTDGASGGTAVSGGSTSVPAWASALIPAYSGCAGGDGVVTGTAGNGGLASDSQLPTPNTGGAGGGGGGGISVDGTTRGIGGKGGSVTLASGTMSQRNGGGAGSNGTAGVNNTSYSPFMGSAGGGGGGSTGNRTSGGKGGDYGAGGGGGGAGKTAGSLTPGPGGAGNLKIRFV